jgi:hypothetical protein
VTCDRQASRGAFARFPGLPSATDAFGEIGSQSDLSRFIYCAYWGSNPTLSQQFLCRIEAINRRANRAAIEQSLKMAARKMFGGRVGQTQPPTVS